MRCDEFEPALHDCLDRGVSPHDDPLVGEHASSCTDCRRKLNSMLALVEATERLYEPGPSAELSARVLGELRAVTLNDSPRYDRSWYSHVPAWGALAASLLLAAFGGYRYGQHDARERLIAEVIETQMQNQNLSPSVAANGENAWPGDPRWLLPQLVQWNPPAKAAVVKNANPRANDDQPVTNDVRSSLAPVANSATAALDNLWQALSAASEDTRS